MNKPYIAPPSLKPGDLIRILAPSGYIQADKVDAAIHGLHNAGFNTLALPTAYKQHYIFSGTDEERLLDLQNALDDPQCKAILMTRGGYGLLRIIDRLNFERFCQFPKWIIGFSDITVLHSRLHQLGFQSLHATMCAGFYEEDTSHETFQTFFDALKGEVLNYTVPYDSANVLGDADAVLCGGNAAMLSSLSGSKDDINTDGKILFLEEVGEYLYRFDRILYTLKRSGRLENIAGLIVGGLSDMKNGDTPFGKTPHELIRDILVDKNIPICFNFPAGHISDNRALIFGRKVQLKVDKIQSHIIFVND